MASRSRGLPIPTATAERSSQRRARIREDLARLGVAQELREELSRRLDRLASHLSAEAYDAALAGAALAHGVRTEGQPAQRRKASDLEEIHRLLGGFADELRKVDEALRILSAYVRRMRTRAGPGGARTLH